MPRATRIVLQQNGGIDWVAWSAIITACAEALGDPNAVNVHGSIEGGWTIERRGPTQGPCPDCRGAGTDGVRVCPTCQGGA